MDERTDRANLQDIQDHGLEVIWLFASHGQADRFAADFIRWYRFG